MGLILLRLAIVAAIWTFRTNVLKISCLGYINLSISGIFNRFSASYAPTDQMELADGYDNFYAARDNFAIYHKNSEVWLKLKYSF